MSVNDFRKVLFGAVLALIASAGCAGGDDVAETQDNGSVEHPDIVWIRDTSLPDFGPLDTGHPGDTGTTDAAKNADSGYDPGPAVEPGYFGAACETNNECYVGFCVETRDGGMCSKGCYESEDCPSGWSCKQVLQMGDPIYICIPSGVWLCRPCEANDDCTTTIGAQNDRCIPYGADGNYCGSSCGEADDPSCPENYSCQDVVIVGGGESKQCAPDTGECDCSYMAKKVNASTTCFKTHTEGTCFGERECIASGLTACNAPPPGPEVCDGIDNDCDGVTDQENSEGCITYYQDNDQDGWGLGIGKCLCGDPGDAYTTKPGDCNDSSQGMNPAVDEVCNGMDDDCNGITDDQGAVGCRNYYVDNDGDGWGQAGDKRCLCTPLPPYTGEELGDCDDARKDVCPDYMKCAEECDGLDNNCDGYTDTENAIGCIPWYFDGDQDGFGLPTKFKCLCTSTGGYTTTKAGDCDDLDADVNALSGERCNGLDDNCNGKTDEGEAAVLCPPGSGVDLHGDVACEGRCTVTGCALATTDTSGNFVPAWYDINSNYLDGCECQADFREGTGGATCNTSIYLGNVPDSGYKIGSDKSAGNVVPATDEDWYVVDATDPTWNAEPDTCDRYNFRVFFAENPGNRYLFDVYRGSCASADGLCSGARDHEWATNFSKNTTTAGAVGGECSCSMSTMQSCDAPASYDACIAKHGDPFKCGSCPGYAGQGSHRCLDNGARVYIRVYQDATKQPSCMDYELEVSNGLYPFSNQ